MDYAQSKYYRDSRWLSKRTSILERDQYTCIRCGKKCAPSELHVHHLNYVRGKKAWEYPDIELITLCKGCHSKEHGILPPSGGWEYCGEDDLGFLSGECERCGREIRYEHQIYHPKWGYMIVGSGCADLLTNSSEASEQEERSKKLAQRFRRYVNSPRWKHHKNGYFIEMDGYQIKIWKHPSYCNIQIKFPLWEKGKRIFKTLSSKKRYDSLESAKEKAFSTITDGSLSRYIRNTYPNCTQYPSSNDEEYDY